MSSHPDFSDFGAFIQRFDLVEDPEGPSGGALGQITGAITIGTGALLSEVPPELAPVVIATAMAVNPALGAVVTAGFIAASQQEAAAEEEAAFLAAERAAEQATTGPNLLIPIGLGILAVALFAIL